MTGGGIYVHGTSRMAPVIQHNKIVDNVACKCGGIYLDGNSSNTVRNNIIAFNRSTSTDTAGIFLTDKTSDNLIHNNVIAYNLAGLGGGAGAIEVTGTSDYATDIRNNILYRNTSVGYNVISVVSVVSSAVIEYNDSYQNEDTSGTNQDYSGGTGNLNANPQFAAWASFATPSGGGPFIWWHSLRFVLQATSPCVDAGDPDSSFDDLDSTRNDMGAYGGLTGEW